MSVRPADAYSRRMHAVNSPSRSDSAYEATVRTPRGSCGGRSANGPRLSTTAALLTALGGSVEEQPSGLIVHGRGRLTGGTADACGDHRIAMSAAAAACICEKDITVTGSECVSKSYPRFWEDLQALKGGAL